MFKKPYSDYSVEEFALDDLFVRWVQHPQDDEVAIYWQNWLANHPQCREKAETARQLILEASEPRQVGLSERESYTLWTRIRESLQHFDNSLGFQKPVRKVVDWWYYVRAMLGLSALVLFTGLACWMQYGPNQRNVVVKAPQTPYQTIQLPDGSQICLLPQSYLTYGRQGFSRIKPDEYPRAVWLWGGADFMIQEQPEQLFRIHTANLTIETNYTELQVREIADSTQVAVWTGQAEVLVQGKEPIRLYAGQQVSVAAASLAIVGK